MIHSIPAAAGRVNTKNALYRSHRILPETNRLNGSGAPHWRRLKGLHHHFPYPASLYLLNAKKSASRQTFSTGLQSGSWSDCFYYRVPKVVLVFPFEI